VGCAQDFVGKDQIFDDVVLEKSVNFERQILVLRTDAGVPDKASDVGSADHGMALLSVLTRVWFF
jgi:hypothetical protein